MVFFCSEDAHILNKQRGQLLMVRNNLFQAPSETEMKGVLGKKKNSSQMLLTIL